MIGASTSFGGGLETGLAHLEKAIELYDPLRHGSNRFRLGPSTAIVARVASGLLRWQCGDLEQAVARVEEAQRVAAELDHPYSIAYAHYHSGFLALNRGRFDDTAEHARQLARVAEENDYVLWQTLAKVLQGVSLTAGGMTEEGVAMTETGITIYQDLTTPPVFWPLVLALRSTVHAMAGNPAHALELIEEAIEVGAPDEGAYPEFRMFRGDYLRMVAPPDDDAAEQAYLAAIRGASGGGLRYTELQARNRLVTLYRDLGRHPDGSEELASLYAGFTEGHDEMEMVRTRALLG